jgi:hypothetical protein
VSRTVVHVLKRADGGGGYLPPVEQIEALRAKHGIRKTEFVVAHGDRLEFFDDPSLAAAIKAEAPQPWRPKPQTKRADPNPQEVAMPDTPNARAVRKALDGLQAHVDALSGDAVMALAAVATGKVSKAAEAEPRQRLAKALSGFPSDDAIAKIAAEAGGVAGVQLQKHFADAHRALQDEYLATVSPQAHAAAGRRG